MESPFLKKPNIIINCNLKDSKCLQPNINKIGKNKIKKIKYIYVDSSERTKDETFTKFEKINDHKNLKQSYVNKNKKRLTQTNPIKKIRHKNFFIDEEDITGFELKLANNKNHLKNNNFKFFNFNSLLEWRARTLDKNKEGKKYKIKLNIINDKNLDKRDSTIKQKTNYNINTLNENDLIYKIKNINYEKFVANCYKRVKNVSKENKINDNQEEHNQNNKIKKNLKTNNIFCFVKINSDKNGINLSQSQMKAYTKMSERIKHNIIEKKGQKATTRKLSKKISQKIQSIKNKRKINIYDKYSKSISDNFQVYNSEKNNINLNKNINSEENIDLLDVPQRRPGCTSKRNSKEIYTDLNSRNEKDSTYELLRKSEYLIGLKPRTTFTKTLKKTQKLNNINSTSSQKQKSNLTSNLINSIIKKFKDKRLNIESYNKAIISRKKYLNIKNEKNYINLKDNISKAIKRRHKEILTDSKFAFIERNIKDNSFRNISLKNNSFNRNHNHNIVDYKKKINKNSVIKRINFYIKKQKIFSKDYKKSFTASHTLSSFGKENKIEKNKLYII